MNKILLFFLAFASSAQACITDEDAKSIYDHMGLDRVYLEAKHTREKFSHSLARFAQACTFNTSDIRQNLNWYERRGGFPSGLYRLTSMNCSQLAAIMKEMAKNTEKYDADLVERLEKSASEIDAAK